MQYSYLTGTLLLLAIWCIFYFSRKDLKREILIVSLILGVLGVLFEYRWYVNDWVHPITITHTKVGIEDFILGFSAGGIATSSYKLFLHKTVYRSSKFHNNWLVVIPLLTIIVITDLLFRYFGLFSFIANTIGFGVALVLILIIRKDLIKEALLGGMILTAITIPVYWALFLFFPKFLTSYWNMDHISGILFMGIPYEDLVWWFVAAALVSVIYEFCLGLRIRRTSNRTELR